MTNITFSVDNDLHQKMKNHPEIKWSEIFRNSIRNYLKNLETPKRISGKALFQRIHLQTEELPIEEELKLRRQQVALEKKRIKSIIKEETKTLDE
jgi:hypothetical protein